MVTGEAGDYQPGAEIVVSLDSQQSALMKVFTGTSRYNVSTAVQGNQTVPSGAPIRVPIENGLIVVLYTSPTATKGSATFSYHVEGTSLKWFERSRGLYYLFLAGLIIIALSLVGVIPALSILVLLLVLAPFALLVALLSCLVVFVLRKRSKQTQPGLLKQKNASE